MLEVMTKHLLGLALLIGSAAPAAIVPDVRKAIAKNDFAQGESLVEAYRARNGVTSEMIEAVSWLGRGALAAKRYDKAETYAEQARGLALEQLKKRKLEADRSLPLALGASIEVQAQAMAARGERSAALAFLQTELKTWHGTSIRARIQKNVHLLSLEGKPAPAIDVSRHLGPAPPPLEKLKGKPVLMFFWAHWCPDCKLEAPVLARLQSEFGGKGLEILGPTQRYGYVAGGIEAPPEQELRYIDQVRREQYSGVPSMPVIVSEETFKEYGASTTPTIVLIDRSGIVRLYHPGRMTYDELAPRVAALVGRT